MTVTFKNQVEETKRALHALLSALFNGGTHTVGDEDIDFHQAKLVYNVDERVKSEGLTITLLGETTRRQKKEKCIKGSDHGYEVRSDITMTVFISSPYQISNTNKAKKIVDQAWGQLFAAIETGKTALANSGIFNAELDFIPSEDKVSEDYYQVSGNLDFQLRAKFIRYNTA